MSFPILMGMPERVEARLQSCLGGQLRGESIGEPLATAITANLLPTTSMLSITCRQ